MADLDAVLGRQACRDQRPVTCLRVALDAQERRRKRRDDRPEVGSVEDLCRVAALVVGRQAHSRALAHARARVLGVLQLAQLGRRRQLAVVLVRDAGLGQRRLQPYAVGPRVVRSAHAPPLAHVEQPRRAGDPQRRQEGRLGEAIDADRPDGHARGWLDAVRGV